MTEQDQRTLNFLTEILSMDEFENEVLIQELMRNFDVINTLFEQIPTPLNYIYSHVKSAKKSSFTSLKIINRKIRSRQLVSEKTLIMFITSEPNRRQQSLQFDRYKALIITSLFLKRIDQAETKQLMILAHEMRLFMTGKSAHVVNKLPDLIHHQKANFDDEWETLIASNEHNATLQQRLKTLLKIVRYFLSFLPQPELNSTGMSPPKWYRKGSSKLTIKADHDGRIELNTFTMQHDIEDIDIQEWETLDEDSLLSESSKQSLISPASIVTDFELERRQAKSMAANMVRQRLKLNCSTSQSTRHDIEALLNYCLSSTSETCQYLLLMLFSGKDITVTSDIKWKRENNAITGYFVKYELPTAKMEQENLESTVISTIEIPLPTVIFHTPPSIPLNDIQAAKCQAVIKSINKSANTNLTLSKVAGFFSQYLKQQNVDIIFNAIFAGSDIRNTPALFYTQVTTTSLLTIKQKYLSTLKQLVENQSINNKEIKLPLPNFNVSHPQLMGSPLPVSEESLIAIFTALKNQILSMIEQIPGCHRCENVVSEFYSFHMLYTVFVQTVITFSSSYRPVNGWGGTLIDYFIEESMLWISDKEYIKGDNSRLVVLPQTTMGILKQYIEYLKIAYENIGEQSPQAKIRIKQALSGEEHLFFYLLDDGTPVEAKPKTTLQHLTILGGIDLIQANWARHQLRTYLHNIGIPTEQVSAWMGHAQGQLHSHGHFSSLAFEGAQGIAKHIDLLLKRLGIEAFSW
ncbi:hypothetical protein [Vibrio rumoiensis]|uniref:hypothetical protein n=1 Tax=Vibrio rumoiensis TaxID=76258 RepID=UPI000B5CE395|nr:hypothetical protein [Vibrio rumoiensis]